VALAGAGLLAVAAVVVSLDRRAAAIRNLQSAICNLKGAK